MSQMILIRLETPNIFVFIKNQYERIGSFSDFVKTVAFCDDYKYLCSEVL